MCGSPDGQGPNDDAPGLGHRVIKFSPTGEVLLVLGEAGVAGDGTDHLLNTPCDVITAPDGSIFVADGHGGQNGNAPPGTVARIVKYDAEGNYWSPSSRLQLIECSSSAGDFCQNICGLGRPDVGTRMLIAVGNIVLHGLL